MKSNLFKNYKITLNLIKSLLFLVTLSHGNTSHFPNYSYFLLTRCGILNLCFVLEKSKLDIAFIFLSMITLFIPGIAFSNIRA